MITLKSAAEDENNQINKDEFNEIAKIMYDSITTNGDYTDEAFISKKEILISSFATFIEQYLKLHFTGSKEKKLQLIKFISKLNRQKELLELLTDETNLNDIHKAGKRLGRKSQSVFAKK